MILEEQQVRARFESGDSVVRALRALVDVGGTPVADYTWEVRGDRGLVRQLRRVTPIGLIGVTEEASADGGGWSLRIQIVSWKASADMAIVRYDTPDDGFWEMHMGDGHPQRIKEDNVAAAMDFIAAMFAAVARRPSPKGGAEASARSLSSR